MFGRLVICKSCDGSVDKTARECPTCHSALMKQGMSAGGLLGFVVFMGSMPGCLLVGPIACLPMMLGALMMLSGKTWSPIWFRLRTFKPADFDRLGIKKGQAAWYTPNEESLVAGGIFLILLPALGLLAYAALR